LRNFPKLNLGRGGNETSVTKVLTNFWIGKEETKGTRIMLISRMRVEYK
jgi:hypothetical protein